MSTKRAYTGGFTWSLREAIEANNLALVKLFLARGADAKLLLAHDEPSPEELLDDSDPAIRAVLTQVCLTVICCVLNFCLLRPPQASLHIACFLGDVAAVSDLCKRGKVKDINEPFEEEECTPLMLAARLDDENKAAQIARKLLEKKADVHSCDRDGDTALSFACQSDYRSLVDVLLKNKADIEIGNALAHAAGDGHLAMCKLLLERKALISGTDREWNPLIHAARFGHLEVCRFLVGAKADIQLTDENLDTAVAAALKNKHTEVVRYLSSLSFHFACENGDAELVKEMLQRKKKPDVNETTRDDLTPLMLAARQGHVEVAKLLIEHGAKVNKQAENGHTALTRAADRPTRELAAERIVEMAKLLLDNKAETYTGNSALMAAIRHSNKDLVALLLQRGASPNAFEGKNWPLEAAMGHSTREICEILLEAKADVRQNHNGKSALQYSYHLSSDAKLLAKVRSLLLSFFELISFCCRTASRWLARAGILSL